MLRAARISRGTPADWIAAGSPAAPAGARRWPAHRKALGTVSWSANTTSIRWMPGGGLRRAQAGSGASPTFRFAARTGLLGETEPLAGQPASASKPNRNAFRRRRDAQDGGCRLLQRQPAGARRGQNGNGRWMPTARWKGSALPPPWASRLPLNSPLGGRQSPAGRHPGSIQSAWRFHRARKDSAATLSVSRSCALRHSAWRRCSSFSSRRHWR